MSEDETIPLPEERIAPSIAFDIERRIQLYFASHTGDVITPLEWKECVLHVVTGMCSHLPEIASLEEEVARLQLQLVNEVEAAKKKTRIETLTQVANTLDSFAGESLGPRDIADVSGMQRAAIIVRRELEQ